MARSPTDFPSLAYLVRLFFNALLGTCYIFYLDTFRLVLIGFGFGRRNKVVFVWVVSGAIYPAKSPWI